MRECVKCEVVKDDNEFAYRNKASGIRHSYCRECVKADNKARRAREKAGREPKRRRKSKTNKRDKLKDLVGYYKEASGCAICGYNVCSAALDLHHLNPNEKESNIAAMTSSVITARELLAELAKCSVLCANCHRELHAGVATLEADNDDE